MIKEVLQEVLFITDNFVTERSGAPRFMTQPYKMYKHYISIYFSAIPHYFFFLLLSPRNQIRKEAFYSPAAVRVQPVSHCLISYIFFYDVLYALYTLKGLSPIDEIIDAFFF